MIEIKNNVYSLQTNNTTYCFRVLSTGHLEHLYYGKKIANMNGEALGYKKAQAAGNTATLDDAVNISLEDICLEMSSYGKGDIRDPFVEITHANGSFTSDFRFKSSATDNGKAPFKTLPGSYGTESEIEHLLITLEDKNYDLILELHYYVFADKDVITRSAKLINNSSEIHTIDRLMSMQLDLIGCDYVVTSFHRNWAREMDKYMTPVKAGRFVNYSYTGTSSSRSNPFFIVSKQRPHIFLRKEIRQRSRSVQSLVGRYERFFVVFSRQIRVLLERKTNSRQNARIKRSKFVCFVRKNFKKRFLHQFKFFDFF